MNNSLKNNGEGWQPAQAENAEGERAPGVGAQAGYANRRPAGCGRLQPEDGHGRVEAERLGQRMAPDVEDHAGHCQRLIKADAKREDPDVLQAGIGKQTLDRHRPPQEGDRDRKRGEPEGYEQVP